MKLLLTISFLVFPSLGLAGPWDIRWKAAKGESTVKWEQDGLLLSDYLFQLPAGHSEANQDREQGLKPSAATTEQLMAEDGRRLIQVLLEVPDSYYSRYLLLLVETAPDRFRPMFIYQYAHSSFGFLTPRISIEGAKIRLEVTTTVHGTSPSESTYVATLDANEVLTTTVQSN